jgi:hypothetical protein
MKTSSAKLKPSSETLLTDESRERLAAITAELDRRRRGWSPHHPTDRQRAFLDLTCGEALYGGAAGGGKSDALLMAALQYADRPGYAALLLRKTFADLALPGALMDRADTWLRGTEAKWNAMEHTWTFPSGATLTFGYLETENSKYRYQSAEFQFVGFDELTQFSETQYTYLFSRLRRLTGSDTPIRMRAASNPGGVGHEWVKQRFISTQKSRDRVFIPAKLAENPHVDQAAYLASLQRLDEVTKAQLLDGNWDVTPAGSYFCHFSRDTSIRDIIPVPSWKTSRTVDFGYHHPAGLWMQESPAGQPFVVAEFVPAFREKTARLRTGEFVDAILLKDAELGISTRYVRTYGDPAGRSVNAQTGESEKAAFKSAGLHFISRPSSVRDGCMRLIELISDPDLPLIVSTACPCLVASLTSVPPDSVHPELYDQSEQSPYQHVLDALRYWAVNVRPAGSGAASVSTSASDSTRPTRNRTF